MKKTLLLLCMAGLIFAGCLKAQTAPAPASHDEKMAWWRDARFGMFIHWGLYSVPAGVYDGHEQKSGGAEWIMNRCKIPVAEYQQYAKQFNPVKYDPDAWVRLAKEAGMKYIVITAKHHEGFAMFKTAASKFNIVDATPYGKDVLAPLAEACRKYGIKLGFYYSQAQDWNNPGGAVARKLAREGWDNPKADEIDAYTAAHHGHWDPAQETRSMADYIDQVAVPQIKELLSNYGDIAVIWWDTPTGMTRELAQKFADILKDHPQIITNDRLMRVPEFSGDFKTPEQKIPAEDQIDGKDLEACMTMNGTWGFRTSDNKWKSPEVLIEHLMDMASFGGNYLLNVGPTSLGEIPEPSIERLKIVGAWLKLNGEALYGTQASPVKKPAWGAITRRDNADTTTLYLTVYNGENNSNWPAGGKLILKANLDATAATMLATGEKLTFQKTPEGIVIQLPATAPAEIASVVKLDLASKLPPRKAMKESGKAFDIVDEK